MTAFVRNQLTWDEIHTAKRWGTSSQPMMCRWANRNLKPSASVLDLGCGIGPNSFWLASEGFEVSAIDISPRAIERMEARPRCHLPIPPGWKKAIQTSVGTAVNLVWPDSFFDAAVDVASLQHITKPDEVMDALREVHRVLKSQGLFFSMTASDRHDPDCFSGMPARMQTRSQAVALYRSAGFEIVNIETAEHSDNGATIAHICLECRKISI